ncbi:MAG: restriction endonuclease [Cyanobacteria bacterium SIG32]|nr:restriction endonuclease [Cyanobacteria bacterium SIG32]
MDEVFEQIFGYKPSKRGKGFEMLTGAVLKIINNANDITHDVKKTGLFSSDIYQIDLLIDDNNESLFVEVKDYSERKSKTGRGDAQKLAGALNNLDVNKGLLVSATGFTNPTIKYSQSTKINPKAKEINLCLLRPTNDKDTENLIFEFVVDATFQIMDHSKSKTNILLNMESLNKAIEELKKEGLVVDKHEARVCEFFDEKGMHLSYREKFDSSIYGIEKKQFPSISCSR